MANIDDDDSLDQDEVAPPAPKKLPKLGGMPKIAKTTQPKALKAPKLGSGVGTARKPETRKRGNIKRG